MWVKVEGDQRWVEDGRAGRLRTRSLQWRAGALRLPRCEEQRQAVYGKIACKVRWARAGESLSSTLPCSVV